MPWPFLYHLKLYSRTSKYTNKQKNKQKLFKFLIFLNIFNYIYISLTKVKYK